MLKFIPVIVICVLSTFVFSQKQISEKEALDLVLSNNSTLKSAALGITQKQQLQKTAFNLDNPEVLMQSPTGQFQTIGVMQSIKFPTVYSKQNQLNKQQTELSKLSEKITINDITYQLKVYYLNHQYATQQLFLFHRMDSLFAQIKQYTDREFSTGTINYLEKTVSDSKYSDIQNKLNQAEIDLQIASFNLQTFTGISEDIATTSISKAKLSTSILFNAIDSTLVKENPTVLYLNQQQKISFKTLELERNKALPGLTFGYLNQADKTTETKFRFQAGITIPIWFWQYKGNIQASKTAIEIAKQNTTSQQQTLTIQLQQAQGNYMKFLESLTYYENIGLMQSAEIVEVSKRFLEAGKDFDYVNYLRTVSEAYTIEFQYLETLKNYNQAVLNMNYIQGNL